MDWHVALIPFSGNHAVLANWMAFLLLPSFCALRISRLYYQCLSNRTNKMNHTIQITSNVATAFVFLVLSTTYKSALIYYIKLIKISLLALVAFDVHFCKSWLGGFFMAFLFWIHLCPFLASPPNSQLSLTLIHSILPWEPSLLCYWWWWCLFGCLWPEGTLETDGNLRFFPHVLAHGSFFP